MELDTVKALAGTITAQTRNNAIFLIALLRKLVEKGILTEDDVREMFNGFDDVASAMKEDQDGAPDSLIATRNFILRILFEGNESETQ